MRNDMKDALAFIIRYAVKKKIASPSPKLKDALAFSQGSLYTAPNGLSTPFLQFFADFFAKIGAILQFALDKPAHVEYNTKR